MSLNTIVWRSDTDEEMNLDAGMVVVSDDPNLFKLPDVPRLPNFVHDYGVVVQLSPLVVVSADGTIRWSKLDPAKLIVVGKASDDVMTICNKRLTA